MAETRPDGTSPSSRKPKRALDLYILCAFVVAAIVVVAASSFLHKSRNPAIEQNAVRT